MSLVKNQLFFDIDSAQRLSGTNENFLYQINIPKDSKLNRVCLISANIPKSYYLVQAGFNTFTLSEAAGNSTITIAAGNYSKTTFAAYLGPLLTAASQNGWTYTVTWSTTPNTGKFTYTASGGSGAQPSIIVTTNLYEQLGFNANSTNTFVAGSLTSTNVYKFIAEDSLYIHSNIVGDGQTDVLEKMSGAAPDFSTITYLCPEPEAYSHALSSSKSNVFSFSLTDENKNVMVLNGQNMTLRIIVFQRDDIHEKLSNFLAMVGAMALNSAPEVKEEADLQDNPE